MTTTACVKRIQVKDHDFESPYTDREAADKFRNFVENGIIVSGFGVSLFENAKKYKRYTAGQIPWVHILVAQVEQRPTKPNTTSTQLTGLEKIHAHLTNCRTSCERGGKGLLHPMVGFTVGDQTVVLKLAGRKSRHFGKVSVAQTHKYGDGDFYGWIDESGNMESKYPIPQAVADILTRVATDPAAVINEMGKESGRCCYCFAELSQVGSKIAGCGKTCAGNYGIPYPKTSEIRLFVAANPEILEGSSDRIKWE